jgi:tetratricopeptide (TPR) repeat protein
MAKDSGGSPLPADGRRGSRPARWLVASLLWGSLLLGSSGAVAVEPPSPAAVEQAIRELGHDEYAVREAASRQLWEWGEVLEPRLKLAAAGKDAEIRVRARLLLEKFALGITPDTPPEVERLLTQFPLQDLNEKRNLLQQLINERKVKIAFRLARMTKDDAERKELLYLASRQAQRFVPDLLVAGELDEAQAVLEAIDQTVDSTQERLTALALVSGRLPEQLRQAEAKLKTEANPGLVKRVIYLRRAAGDWRGAAELAGQHQLFYYQRAILLEGGDWKQAAAVQKAQFQGDNLAAETLALSAALHGLAGDSAPRAERLQQLRDNTTDQLSTYWDAAEAHLVCQEFDQALLLLEKSIPGAAANIHGLRMDYARALELAGVTADSKLDAAWYEGLVDGGKVATQKSMSRAEFAEEIVNLLQITGQRARARQVVDLIRAKAAGDMSGRSWHALLRADVTIGDRTQALVDLEQALGNPNIARSELFRAVYSADVVPLLDSLYPCLGTEAERRAQSLQVIEQLLGPEGVDAESRKLLVAKVAATLQPTFDAKLLRQERAGELMLKLGDRDTARIWFTRAAESTSDGQIRLGDMAREDKNWEEAAKWYRAATERLPALPLPRYLLGLMLQEQGREKEGQEEIFRANLAAITPSTRYALAFQLKERGLNDAAEAQARLVQQTGNPTIQHPTLSAGHLHANLVFRKSPQVAADAWQRWVLSQLMGVNNFTLYQYYLSDPELIHRSHARALLAQGKADQAVAELRRVLAILPGDVRMVEEMTPLLKEAGQERAANELLAAVVARYEQVVRDYPQTSHHRRELALVLARTGQRLDEALALAKQAAELEPQTADNHDALAEVHFIRQEIPAAIAAGEKARDLEKNSAHYRERLKHWQAKAE